MVVVAQLVRASVCGTEGRRFEPGLPPKRQKLLISEKLFLFIHFSIYKKRALHNFIKLFLNII